VSASFPISVLEAKYNLLSSANFFKSTTIKNRPGYILKDTGRRDTRGRKVRRWVRIDDTGQEDKREKEVRARSVWRPTDTPEKTPFEPREPKTASEVAYLDEQIKQLEEMEKQRKGAVYLPKSTKLSKLSVEIEAAREKFLYPKKTWIEKIKPIPAELKEGKPLQVGTKEKQQAEREKEKVEVEKRREELKAAMEKLKDIPGVFVKKGKLTEREKNILRESGRVAPSELISRAILPLQEFTKKQKDALYREYGPWVNNTARKIYRKDIEPFIQNTDPPSISIADVKNIMWTELLASLHNFGFHVIKFGTNQETTSSVLDLDRKLKSDVFYGVKSSEFVTPIVGRVDRDAKLWRAAKLTLQAEVAFKDKYGKEPTKEELIKFADLPVDINPDWEATRWYVMGKFVKNFYAFDLDKIPKRERIKFIRQHVSSEDYDRMQELVRQRGSVRLSYGEKKKLFEMDFSHTKNKKKTLMDYVDSERRGESLVGDRLTPKAAEWEKVMESYRQERFHSPERELEIQRTSHDLDVAIQDNVRAMAGERWLKARKEFVRDYIGRIASRNVKKTLGIGMRSIERREILPKQVPPPVDPTVIVRDKGIAVARVLRGDIRAFTYTDELDRVVLDKGAYGAMPVDLESFYKIFPEKIDHEASMKKAEQKLIEKKAINESAPKDTKLQRERQRKIERAFRRMTATELVRKKTGSTGISMPDMTFVFGSGRDREKVTVHKPKYPNVMIDRATFDKVFHYIERKPSATIYPYRRFKDAKGKRMVEISLPSGTKEEKRQYRTGVAKLHGVTESVVVEPTYATHVIPEAWFDDHYSERDEILRQGKERERNSVINWNNTWQGKIEKEELEKRIPNDKIVAYLKGVVEEKKKLKEKLKSPEKTEAIQNAEGNTVKVTFRDKVEHSFSRDIEDFSPRLSPWQRDVIHILRGTSGKGEDVRSETYAPHLSEIVGELITHYGEDNPPAQPGGEEYYADWKSAVESFYYNTIRKIAMNDPKVAKMFTMTTNKSFEKSFIDRTILLPYLYLTDLIKSGNLRLVKVKVPIHYKNKPTKWEYRWKSEKEVAAGEKVVGKPVHYLKVQPKKGESLFVHGARISPGYKLIWASDTPRGNEVGKIAVVESAKGREKPIYNARHWELAAKEKWERCSALYNDREKLRRNFLKGLKAENKRHRESCEALYLIDHTGIRKGGVDDPLARKKSYGAVSLEKRHVKIKPNEVVLKFVGKEGVKNVVSVTDKILVGILKKKVNSLDRPNDQIFPAANASSVLLTLKDLTPPPPPPNKSYKVHDLRVVVATTKAYEECKNYAAKYGKATSQDSFDSAQKIVAQTVAKTLCNSWKQAIEAYIDPVVWNMLGGKYAKS